MVGIIDTVQMSPIDSAQTHGTGFTGGIYFIACEVEGMQLPAGFAYTGHLCMGSGIVKQGYTIGRSCHYFAILGDNCSEGTSSVFHTFCREADGLAHHLLVLFCDDHRLY
jgi:hypothetical protein